MLKLKLILAKIKLPMVKEHNFLFAVKPLGADKPLNPCGPL